MFNHMIGPRNLSYVGIQLLYYLTCLISGTILLLHPLWNSRMIQIK